VQINKLEALTTGDQRESGHSVLGGVRRHFADHFVIFSGRSARHPTDLEPSAIGILHHVETFAVDIEDLKAGRKRLLEGFAARSPRCIVKCLAVHYAFHPYHL
jgi:hypothetical protein